MLNQDDLIKTLISRGIKIVDKDEKIESYKTIAILYPENLGDKEEEFFCHEFLNQMIDDLKTIDEIRTPSIFDVNKYKGSSESISQISIDLAVQNANKALEIKRNYGPALIELGRANINLCNKVAAEDALNRAKRYDRRQVTQLLDWSKEHFKNVCK